MNSPVSYYRRRPARTVFIGQVGIGSNHPIRIQSMTTSDTKDTVAVTREIRELAEAGCEIVRLTVPTSADCDNLPNIRRELKGMGVKVPIVADIHFTPGIAMKAAEYVEKVRINPGNYADRKLFKVREYGDEEYRGELARIEEKFAPLVLKCQGLGVAMRIGVNHGSLSDRVMNRYGDTPEGMVASALEFLRIAARLSYNDIVLSMKSSDPRVMVAAYRLLVKRMAGEGFDHPLHLGVTEAGDGEDARVKSAVGIGSLLEEGIGDTVRVSLTEDSIRELPVAGALVAPYNQKFFFDRLAGVDSQAWKSGDSPTLAVRRQTTVQKAVNLSWGGSEPVRVWADGAGLTPEDAMRLARGDAPLEGVELAAEDGTTERIGAFRKTGQAIALISDNPAPLVAVRGLAKRVFVIKPSRGFEVPEKLIAAFSEDGAHLELCFDARNGDLHRPDFRDELARVAERLRRGGLEACGFSLVSNEPAGDYELLKRHLDGVLPNSPLHLRYTEGERPAVLDASAQLGRLLIDGVGDSIQINGDRPAADRVRLAYAILQAARARISKTEFIACPSCGRTQFDLQSVTARIKGLTSHLKGLKIAVMGCIVNGPGEMADADFGYVGTGPGRVSLYVGKEVVERHVPEAEALERLVAIIRNRNRWTEPVPSGS